MKPAIITSKLVILFIQNEKLELDRASLTRSSYEELKPDYQCCA